MSQSHNSNMLSHFFIFLKNLETSPTVRNITITLCRCGKYKGGDLVQMKSLWENIKCLAGRILNELIDCRECIGK